MPKGCIFSRGVHIDGSPFEDLTASPGDVSASLSYVTESARARSSYSLWGTAAPKRTQFLFKYLGTETVFNLAFNGSLPSRPSI